MKAYLFIHRVKQNRGFSLVELMIALLIGSLLIMSLSSLDILVKKKFVFDTGLMDIHAGARNAMDWMTKDIREAIRIVDESKTITSSSYIISSGALVTSNSTSYQTSNGVLVLELPCTSGGNVTGVATTPNCDYIVYSVLNLVTSTGKNLAILQRAVDSGIASDRSEMLRKFVISESPTDVSGTRLSLLSSGQPLSYYDGLSGRPLKSTLTSLTIDLKVTKQVTGAPNTQSVNETLNTTVMLRN